MQIRRVTRYNFRRRTASWANLPNEIRAHIVKYMDPSTTFALRGLGFNEMDLVKRFSKVKTRIRVQFIHHHCMRVALHVMTTQMAVFTWIINERENSCSEVVHRDGRGTLLGKFTVPKKVETAAFHLIGRIHDDPMIDLKSIYFILLRFKKRIDWGPHDIKVDNITLDSCLNPRVIRDLLMNSRFNFRHCHIKRADRPYIEQRLWERSRMAVFIRNIEEQYVRAFPRNYVITGEEDAVRRMRMFLGEVNVFREAVYNDIIYMTARNIQDVRKYMMVRAAYTHDRVVYLYTPETERAHHQQIEVYRSVNHRKFTLAKSIPYVWLLYFIASQRVYISDIVLDCLKFRLGRDDIASSIATKLDEIMAPDIAR